MRYNVLGPYLPAGHLPAPAKEVVLNKLALISVILLALSRPAPAAVDPAPLEKVSRALTAVQPGLKNYLVTVQTSKIEEMLKRMTANMPPDMPRPAVPVLRKYWLRSAGAALIRAEGESVFPYMQEMAARFSREFAVDLWSLFLPARAADRRRALLGSAAGQIYETRLEQSRTLTVAVTFPAPADLDGAFYGYGLDLPQQGVKTLVFDIDPDLQILKRLEITTDPDRHVIVEVRYAEVKEGHLPQEIRITTPDGSIDDRFATTFGPAEGYLLPVRQVHLMHRPDHQETITVDFSGYRVNTSFPDEVMKQLSVR